MVNKNELEKNISSEFKKTTKEISVVGKSKEKIVKPEAALSPAELSKASEKLNFKQKVVFRIKNFLTSLGLLKDSKRVKAAEEIQAESIVLNPDLYKDAEVKKMIKQILTLQEENTRLESELNKITQRDIEDPKVVDDIAQELTLGQKLIENVLIKIGRAQGSNKGGFYEDRKTGQEYYLKIYENPDQARVEFVANKIYEKLGIRAVQSELSDANGDLVIASKVIKGAKNSSMEELRESDQVRNGFIADAYLANWDVVGLGYDNIVKDDNGNFVRIDSGGSLIFRAQGDLKNLPADNIPELETMQNPKYQSGQVFQGLSEEQLKMQAQNLVENIDENFIDEIIDEAGFSPKQAQIIREGLVGRRKYLMQRFEIAEQKKKSRYERVVNVFDSIGAKEEKKFETFIRGRLGMIADGGDIEDQLINIIDSTDEGEYEINFKLTMDKYINILKQLEDQKTQDKAKMSTIDYGRKDNTVPLVEAYEVDYDGIKIKVSAHGIMKVWNKALEEEKIIQQRSTLGLVQIKVKSADFELDKETMAKKVEDIFKNFFKISGGLEEPTKMETKKLKKEMYCLHHHTDDLPANFEKRIQRQEVFPNYFTMVEEGKSKEYEKKYGNFAMYHAIGERQGKNRILSILKSGGLMSSHERYKRAFMVDGASTSDDFELGGADSAFVRTISQKGFKKTEKEKGKKAVELDKTMPYNIIIDNSIMDRLDWYAYESDYYGSTEEEMRHLLQSPKNLFEQQAQKGWNMNNEQMFKCGIAQEKFIAIVCRTQEQRLDLINYLKENAMSSINNIPVEEFIKIADEYGNFLDIARNRQSKLIKKVS